MKKNLLLLMLALLLPAFMYGQEQTVSGTVLDTYNMGVPGASIVEKGTTNGTITDFDGNYTLTVSNKNATLVFSFIGYKTQEIPVAGKAKVDVILQENAEQLDEVVVTGYGGSQKRATLTTSISKLDNAVLENAAMSKRRTILARNRIWFARRKHDRSAGSKPKYRTSWRSYHNR